MKVLSSIIPALALSSPFALAQTSPIPPTTPTTPATQDLFIPLFGNTSSSSSSSATSTTSTWFIDVTNRQVVFCSQPASSTGTAVPAQQAFTCTAQPVPAATPTGTAPGTTPTAPAAGVLPFGTS